MKNCKDCGKEIQRYEVIDGVTKDWGSRRRYCVDCSPRGNNGHKKNMDKSTNTKQCKVCEQWLPYTSKFFNPRAGRKDLYSICKTCKSKSTIDSQRQFKIDCIEYAGGHCKICGYDKYAGALAFHHLNPATKDFKISGKYNLNDVIKKELDKCVLVCSRCHDEIHGGLHPDYITLT